LFNLNFSSPWIVWGLKHFPNAQFTFLAAFPYYNNVNLILEEHSSPRVDEDDMQMTRIAGGDSTLFNLQSVVLLGAQTLSQCPIHVSSGISLLQ
jgi:hypothetical protein